MSTSRSTNTSQKAGEPLCDFFLVVFHKQFSNAWVLITAWGLF